MEGFQIGRVLIIIGAVLIGLGLLFNLMGNVPWLGRLPGDIYIRRENFVFFFPITTMVLISLILTLILRLLR